MKAFFYQMSAVEALKQLESDPKKGLSAKEAKNRLEIHGFNELKEVGGRSAILRFFDQFKDLMIVVLIVAALLAYYLGDVHGGTVLFVIVLMNAFIGFYQEFKAERILASLKKMVHSRAIVIRDGARKEIESRELVPGDRVYLEEGSAIPADVRLIKTVCFSTNDFILTGESVPQEKNAELVFDKAVTITDQDNCVFLGTTVARGNAEAVVFATGMETAIGRIARTSQEIGETLSPLQLEFNHLAKTLTKLAGAIALGIFALNFILNFNSGESIEGLLQVSVLFALGVAASCIPQGLPAQVSVALSLGVGRMAKEKAVVKKLSAVETLGSTTLICSDKTGTITKNEMTITGCWLMDRQFRVTGEGYEPKGSVVDMKGKKVSAAELLSVKQFFYDGFLAGNGRVNPPDEDHTVWYPIGDPTEAAFMTLAMKAGLSPEDLERNFTRVAELPFDSDRKRMTIVREHKGKRIAMMKGGAESVLSVCQKINEGGKVSSLTEKKRKEILQTAEGFSRQALRVIALAYRDLPEKATTYSIENTEKEFTFAGFVTMLDPPRQGVKEAVEAAFKAHIKVMMITGDNAVTAIAIAESIGMKEEKGDVPVFTGDEIKTMSNDDLKKLAVHRSVIFARVSPEDKYRLVKLFTESGEVVAVTGDGVNDTLSLKQADIGVAMGQLGSEVAKEAAEIVLLDDNFSTLVNAIREGRTIFQNLKKAILGNMTANFGELTCVLLGFAGMGILGLPNTITAVQILAVDLIGEILPLMSLTFDAPERSLMEEKPRNLKEHVVNRRTLLPLFFYGFWIGMAGFFSFFMIYRLGGGTLAQAQTGAYLGILFSQYVSILSIRTERSVFTRYFWANRQLLAAFAISLLMVASILYVPQISLWFGFEGLPPAFLLYPMGGALFSLFLQEGRKMLKAQA